MCNTTKQRILIVEDDKDLRTILKLQLVSSGYEVTEAENGAEGFKEVKVNVPDCIVLDLMMPVMDGFGFLKRARSLNDLKDIPIIILTASEDERHRMRGSQYQANCYMSKPYDLEELTETVTKLCAGEKIKQSNFL